MYFIDSKGKIQITIFRKLKNNHSASTNVNMLVLLKYFLFSKYLRISRSYKMYRTFQYFFFF